MIRTRSRTAISLIALFCALCLFPQARAASELQQKQKALDAVVSRIKALSDSIDKDQAEKDHLSRQMQQIERRIAASNRKLGDLRKQIQSQSDRIHDTQNEISAAREDIERRTEALRQQIRAAYIIGRQGQTRLLLNQSDVAKVGRVLVYYDYFQRAQATALNAIHDHVASLEALSERLQGELARLSALKSDQESELKQLRDSRSERADVLKALRGRLADEQGELKRLKEDEQSIQSLIEQLRDAVSELPDDAFSNEPFTKLRGKLPWPVRGRLIARFGQDKVGGKLSWNGNWISAEDGTPVRAVARGRVVYVGWMHRYGLIVLIEHEGGYFSLYGHAQSATVSVGDAVRAGQIIARAGSTGGHERSGLYFELRHGAKAIDPGQWLAR